MVMESLVVSSMTTSQCAILARSQSLTYGLNELSHLIGDTGASRIEPLTGCDWFPLSILYCLVYLLLAYFM